MPEIKFEESLNKLEKIVAGLETGTISLEDSLKKYEEGIKLARFCSHKLEEAEQKIEILTQDKDGKLTREPFKTNQEKQSGPAKNKTKQEENFLF